ncbi:MULTISPECIES: DegT/DnrJ/EryC1/StrS family aminotransferase [Roseobacteraceae]|uniref:dTDP-4-amino-4,6-dideoxygalactose transaminase n=3 Tax=Roseobacteraceae TaxID=2854170 RepID=A0ABY1IFD9_9RHOB|nr:MULTISPECIES: aminotransferase class I/II-fold pyridoxal phosphate-dependent enzyme [Roseobacteraceae]CRK76338.1 Putative pyridoxal phosphate-dependent aminotransferase EpsN [Nereida ignava]CUH61453.1 Putative pyridoxal phosphate-dependent aminotransferase EpsN [Thalassobacter stenotrophicus]SFJ79621.1 dTDP-4-amino-4,6-dideoxygalactose transaminase [Nereida ignava DSM 16309]SHJ09454.1 dTDP-4-amino-4,6-dideoxygalactose transaminase [Thalassobacter stenotrophicus DSM 16310]
MRIYLSRPHMSGNEERRVAEAFASNFIAPLGPQLDAFEASVRDYLGADVHCVGLSSGSAALHLALRIAGVGPGDEVWISSMTFAGGIFPVNYLGASPRFFDLSPESWTVDTALLAKELAKAATENRLPKAIVPTDLYGQSADLDTLESLAAQYGVRLIVDSAESLGATYKNGRKAGTGGDAAILSFNGNKIITTSGGGMLVTRHKAWADEARFLATQARDPAPHYEHSTFGYNYRLSNICAAIGLGQMEVLDARVARRREIFARYKAALARPGIAFMPEPEGLHSTRWLTALTIDPSETGITREDIRLMLLEHQIESRPLWKPMHMQPLYAGAPYHGNGFDERLFANGLCLPSGSDMTDEQQDEVIERVSALLDKGR